jgi:beta-glucosidase-like glycosyl hydrolase
MRTTRLLLPAIRWDAATRFAGEARAIDAALARGVGGFVLFGGDTDAVRTLTADLYDRSPEPLLIGSDLERGAGQQFRGATQLPPLAAIGSLDDLSITRQAAALTAREALALGVNWIFAPVADLDIEPRNPIVGTRAFGADPVRVAAHVTAWIEGCRAEGALCCAKHFPGHGRTVADSHETLPTVDATREELETDLTPFRAAVVAGVDAIMTAHVAFPALDPAGVPATLSAPILDLLRQELGFEGLVVTDALIMKGLLAGDDEAAAAVKALSAGCDTLLYPADLQAVADAVENAGGKELPRARLARALGRVNAVVAAAPAGGKGAWGRATDGAWALAIATRSIRFERGSAECPRDFDLLTLDDDLGGPYPPPSRDAFLAGLRDAGFDPRPVAALEPDRPGLIAVYADIRGWKGTPALREAARERLSAALERRPDALVVLFGHARLAPMVPSENLVVAWGGEAVMQRAASRWLANASLPPDAA